MNFMVNDIKNFVYSLANAVIYGFGKSWKQKFVMSFTIVIMIRNARLLLAGYLSFMVSSISLLKSLI